MRRPMRWHSRYTPGRHASIASLAAVLAIVGALVADITIVAHAPSPSSAAIGHASPLASSAASIGSGEPVPVVHELAAPLVPSVAAAPVAGSVGAGIAVLPDVLRMSDLMVPDGMSASAGPDARQAGTDARQAGMDAPRPGRHARPDRQPGDAAATRPAARPRQDPKPREDPQARPAPKPREDPKPRPEPKPPAPKPPAPKPPPQPEPRPEPAPQAGAWRNAPMATWYGPGLYGNGTACGQRYTREIIGVAHRTLPCGTLVQLRWQGMTATVPVIDRGPFGHPDNVFDLSAALACDVFRPRQAENGCFTRYDVKWRIVERR